MRARGYPLELHVGLSCAPQAPVRVALPGRARSWQPPALDAHTSWVLLSVCLRQIVTPWDVEADDDEGIDYDKLIDRFGSQRISPELIARMERLTGKKGA